MISPQPVSSSGMSSSNWQSAGGNAGTPGAKEMPQVKMMLHYIPSCVRIYFDYYYINNVLTRMLQETEIHILENESLLG